MSQTEAGAGRQVFWLTVAAFVWSAALVAAAFVLPLYGCAPGSAPCTNSLKCDRLRQVLLHCRD
jgi:hypothetical protein